MATPTLMPLLGTSATAATLCIPSRNVTGSAAKRQPDRRSNLHKDNTLRHRDHNTYVYTRLQRLTAPAGNDVKMGPRPRDHHPGPSRRWSLTLRARTSHPGCEDRRTPAESTAASETAPPNEVQSVEGGREGHRRGHRLMPKGLRHQSTAPPTTTPPPATRTAPTVATTHLTPWARTPVWSLDEVRPNVIAWTAVSSTAFVFASRIWTAPSACT